MVLSLPSTLAEPQENAPMIIGFWLLVGLIAYAYLGYPLLLALLAQWPRRRPAAPAPPPRWVSIVVAAHDEAAHIARRLDELADMLTASGVEGEIIVVSDASTDRTAALARAFRKAAVRVLELPVRSGKAAALSAGCALAGNDILVFADTRQAWSPDALRLLLENFSDPKNGAVSGELIVGAEPGILSGVGLYWRYEKWLRTQESRLHSTVGVTGAICAVRRELFRPIPRGTILDDVYWPLQVAMQGHRVIHDRRARA
jgi:cellulose synthase/poly-beta-1,6-N-acetylglucosamine synthase-like glycosyltransferase